MSQKPGRNIAAAPLNTLYGRFSSVQVSHSFQVLFSRFALDLTFGDMHTTTSASKTITIMYDGPLSDTIEQLLHL